MNYQIGHIMKEFEFLETKRKFIPMVPIVARIDGKSFHTWTRGLDKPFCDGFVKTMFNTTLDLAKETNSLFSYVQSDEISLLFFSDNLDSQVFFDGKIFKMTSVLASMATAMFNSRKNDVDFLSNRKPAMFDCRVFQLPNKDMVYKYFIWREMDAVRNSVQALGQANFSHSELQNKSSNKIKEMLKQKNIFWDELEEHKKRGYFFQRKKTCEKISKYDLDSLPPKHNLRKNPNLAIERTIINLDVKSVFNLENPSDVMFNGADPMYKLDGENNV